MSCICVCVVFSAGRYVETTHTQYMICCHITHNNEIFIILTRDFSKEQEVLPEDDMRYAIETCRSSFSVNNFRLIYDIQLVQLLVCNIQ